MVNRKDSNRKKSWQEELMKKSPKKPKDSKKSVELDNSASDVTLEDGVNDINELDIQLNDDFGDDIAGVKKALKETEDKLLRSYAEMKNVQRRSSQDIQNAYRYSIEKFTKELLPVVDSLEKALEIHTDESEITDGIKLTLKMFLDVLAKHGIVQVYPLHKPFDPQRHEAMSMQENTEFPPNTVLQVLQCGYLLNNRLIRPAMVVVSKAK